MLVYRRKSEILVFVILTKCGVWLHSHIHHDLGTSFHQYLQCPPPPGLFNKCSLLHWHGPEAHAIWEPVLSQYPTHPSQKLRPGLLEYICCDTPETYQLLTMGNNRKHD